MMSPHPTANGKIKSNMARFLPKFIKYPINRHETALPALSIAATQPKSEGDTTKYSLLFSNNGAAGLEQPKDAPKAKTPRAP